MAPGVAPTHILHLLYLNDLLSVRRVMYAIDYYLTTHKPSPYAPETNILEDNEEETVANICRALQKFPDHHLLLHATILFAQAKEESDEEVTRAIIDYVAIADEDVLLDPGKYGEEYEEAERRFYEVAGYNRPAEKDLMAAAPAFFAWKRHVARKNGYDDMSDDDPFVDHDDEDTNSNEGYDEGLGGLLQKTVSKPRHYTLRKQNQYAIDDGKTQRYLQVTVGKRKEAALNIEFAVEQEDLSNPGKFRRIDNTKFMYHEVVDWNDQDSVTNLRAWRCSIFGRAFGTVSTTNNHWLEKERDALYDILTEQLSSEATGGQYSKIDWEVCTKELNKKFVGKAQLKGEWVANQRYNFLDNNGNVMRVHVMRQHLKSHRNGKARPVGVVKAAFPLFEDKRGKGIMKVAKHFDDKARGVETPRKKKNVAIDISSDDEVEDIDDEDEAELWGSSTNGDNGSEEDAEAPASDDDEEGLFLEDEIEEDDYEDEDMQE
ncbi:hypothetical protein B0J14DRAFT_560151 [Halenospora varia]|nr:hypothetical protein B0J14DRAFT_560151 [Halenospora varia]